MYLLSLEDLRDHLGVPGTHDDHILDQKLKGAQRHVERLLGYRIEDRFGGEDQEPVPDDLREAILQLAAWWYEQREAAVTGTIVQAAPHNLGDIVRELREWSF